MILDKGTCGVSALHFFQMCMDMEKQDPDSRSMVTLHQSEHIEITHFRFGALDAEISRNAIGQTRYRRIITRARVHIGETTVEIRDDGNYSKWVTEPTIADLTQLDLYYKKPAMGKFPL